MDAGLIPHRYAKALYKFAEDQGNSSQVYDEMKIVIESFKNNPRLTKILSNPFVGRKEKFDLLKAAAGGKAENDYLGFIKLILDKRREEFAFQMALAYCEIYRAVNKISQVTITTAINLPEKEYKKLQTLVSGMFKDRTLEFTGRVNPDIIGGFIIDVDDTRMDASVISEIEQLRLNLLSHA